MNIQEPITNRRERQTNRLWALNRIRSGFSLALSEKPEALERRQSSQITSNLISQKKESRSQTIDCSGHDKWVQTKTWKQLIFLK